MCFTSLSDLHTHETAVLFDKPRCEQKTIVDADPEDGISPDTFMLMLNRKSESKINNWDSLWRVLFPDDITVPDPGTKGQISVNALS